MSLASHEGFKEFLIETPALNGYGNTNNSISHTDYDWDYQTVGLHKPIVDTLNTKYASRLQSYSEFAFSETQSSKATRQANSKYPLLFPREEELFLRFFDFFPPTDSWSVNRKYKTSASGGPEQNQTVTNLYPNSGGGGGVDIPVFNPVPAPELSHYYGPEIFSPNSAYAYLLCLFQSTPWNITPWFNQ